MVVRVDLLIAVVAAAIFSAAIVEAVRRWSEHRRRYDHPNERSSHTRPTPRGGGIGIVVSVAGALIALAVTGRIDFGRGLLAFLAAAVLIAIISYIDDVNPLPAAVRFPFHLAAAVIAVLGAGAWSEIALPGSYVLSLGVLAIPLTCIWIAGVTNIYNFMDGIDGIAGAQAVVAGMAWAIIGYSSGNVLLMLAAAIIAAASAGFLAHNWPPARIFMGDVGSAFLGFSFAALPLLSNAKRASFVTAVLVLWPFLFDGTLTILRRLRRRENIFAAHRSHLYQRLNIAGLSHALITKLYAALAILGAAAAVTMHPLALSLVPLAAIALWAFVVSVERRYAARNPSSAISPRIPSSNERGA